MHFLVYKIINLVNGKIYIGAHRTYNKEDNYFGSGLLIKKAIKKYGKSNFLKEILFECSSEDEMFEKEMELVQIGTNFYNLRVGGRAGPPIGYVKKKFGPHTEKSKKNISVGVKEYYKHNPDAKIKISNDVKIRCELLCAPFAGKKHSNETKQKIGIANSINQTGKNNSQYGTCWVYHTEFGNKKINKLDIQNYIDQGYIKGRKF